VPQKGIYHLTVTICAQTQRCWCLFEAISRWQWYVNTLPLTVLPQPSVTPVDIEE